jgi:hypothetical protein
MAWFLKLKFLLILKINFNGGQFYKKILNFRYYKKKFYIKPSRQKIEQCGAKWRE